MKSVLAHKLSRLYGGASVSVGNFKYVEPTCRLFRLHYSSLVEHSKPPKAGDLAKDDLDDVPKNMGFTGGKSISLISDIISSVEEYSKAAQLIRLTELAIAYRTYGHCISTTDPLGLPREAPYFKGILKDIDIRLSPQAYGLSADDMSSKLPNVSIDGYLGCGYSVSECIEAFKRSYCGDLGFEFMHLPYIEERRFFIENIERKGSLEFSRQERLKFFEEICKSVLFERMCSKAFPTIKRFGADGIESLNVALGVIVTLSQSSGVDSLIMGMAHRGRLNVLANIMKKPLEQIFAEFRGRTWFGKDDVHYSGDVKYHSGYNVDYGGVKMELLNNPSHLELVAPAVSGKARARQYSLNDEEGSRVVPVTIHGDAAISGEGIAYETVQMSQVPGYGVGGTINIVVNNQIGFTTYPVEGATSRYPSDLAKVVDSPTIHVNAQNVEAVVFAARLAFEYRKLFHRDVFLNLVGFRRLGHNELDMPKFTNAGMYSRISRAPDVLDVYRSFLISNNIIDEAELNVIQEKVQKEYETAVKKSVELKTIPKPPPLFGWTEEGLSSTSSEVTGFELQKLVEIGKITSTIPPSIQPHPAVKNLFNARLKALDTGKNIDFGLAEALAYGSLASQGFQIRLGGQDSKRGTFSHRHAIVQCQSTFQSFNIFSNLSYAGNIQILNSILSELAVLGFEYGYSIENYKIMNIWEAQFGDFSNMAQAVIDEFVVSGEAKWAQRSGLTLFLPHGFDGQGPDHSSCRVERLLQLSNEHEDLVDVWDKTEEDYARICNISVINCTKSSNLFHALRRQVLRKFRKPLIALTGKRMLKLRGSSSSLEEFGPTAKFEKYIPDPKIKYEDTETLILCSGQLYFDILERRDSLELKNTAIARLEQLCPFPAIELLETFRLTRNLKRLVWCQEEHMNAGAWSYIVPRVKSVISRVPHLNVDLVYTGRRPLEAPSVGDSGTHQAELEEFLGNVIPG